MAGIAQKFCVTLAVVQLLNGSLDTHEFQAFRNQHVCGLRAAVLPFIEPESRGVGAPLAVDKASGHSRALSLRDMGEQLVGLLLDPGTWARGELDKSAPSCLHTCQCHTISMRRCKSKQGLTTLVSPPNAQPNAPFEGVIPGLCRGLTSPPDLSYDPTVIQPGFPHAENCDNIMRSLSFTESTWEAGSKAWRSAVVGGSPSSVRLDLFM